MSGDEMLIALRANPACKDLPVIVLSARDNEEQRLKMLRAGAQDSLFSCSFVAKSRKRGCVLCVRWYLRYALSYHDLEELMRERGLSVDHTTIYHSRPTVCSRD
jgi:CheY-like chemotaxis protein